MKKSIRKKLLSSFVVRPVFGTRKKWFRENGGNDLFTLLYILLRTEFWLSTKNDFVEAMEAQRRCWPLDPAEHCETCCGTYNKCDCVCGIIGDWCACTDTSFDGIALTCSCENGESCDRFCGTTARWNNRDRSQNARKALFLTKALLALLTKYRIRLTGARGRMAYMEFRVVAKHCEKLKLCSEALKRNAVDAAREYRGLAERLRLFYCGRCSEPAT